MTGDKLTIVNWIEHGDDIVIKQMRTVPSGFRERGEETTKVFVAYNKVLEIVKNYQGKCDYGMNPAKAIYCDITALKGGEEE